MSSYRAKQYTCATCSKVYEGRQFHCYEKDFCTEKCMDTVIAPIREAEAKIKADAEQKQRSQGRLTSGGGGCH